jgi:hypothetical protein
MSAPESTEKPYDEMSKQEQEEHDRTARAKEKAEQDGRFSRTTNNVYALTYCIALPYKWTQDLNTATVTVALPSGTRARDLNVVIKKKSLKVSPNHASFLHILTPR